MKKIIANFAWAVLAIVLTGFLCTPSILLVYSSRERIKEIERGSRAQNQKFEQEYVFSLMTNGFNYARLNYKYPTGYEGHGDWYPVTEFHMLRAHLKADTLKYPTIKGDIELAVTTNSPSP